MSNNSCNADFLLDLKRYYKYQEDICYKSRLYDDITEHGSKVVMLFAEIYSFMVDKFGLTSVPKIISEYQNSKVFCNWFWNVKHYLGQEVLNDPSFCDIGKWIGKGFFLKICLSLIYHNHLFTDEYVINQMIEKQKKLLAELLKENSFTKNGKSAITKIENGYILLNEKTILSCDHDLFYKENIIKSKS
jgi:hypothetical protein